MDKGFHCSSRYFSSPFSCIFPLSIILSFSVSPVHLSILLHVSLFNRSSISPRSALHSNSCLQPCKWDPVSVGASGSGSDTCQSPWWQAACFSHLYQITCIVLRELRQCSAEGWESQGPSEEMSGKDIHDPLRMNSPGFSDAASQSCPHVDSSSVFGTSRPVLHCNYCKYCAMWTCLCFLIKRIHTCTDVHYIEKNNSNKLHRLEFWLRTQVGRVISILFKGQLSHKLPSLTKDVFYVRWQTEIDSLSVLPLRRVCVCLKERERET